MGEVCMGDCMGDLVGDLPYDFLPYDFLPYNLPPQLPYKPPIQTSHTNLPYKSPIQISHTISRHSSHHSSHHSSQEISHQSSRTNLSDNLPPQLLYKSPTPGLSTSYNDRENGKVFKLDSSSRRAFAIARHPGCPGWTSQHPRINS